MFMDITDRFGEDLDIDLLSIPYFFSTHSRRYRLAVSLDGEGQ